MNTIKRIGKPVTSHYELPSVREKRLAEEEREKAMKAKTVSAFYDMLLEPEKPVVHEKRLFCEQVKPGTYVSEIIDLRNIEKTVNKDGQEQWAFDVVHKLEGIEGDVLVRYFVGKGKVYTAYKNAMMSYGCESQKEAIGIKERIVVEYDDKSNFGKITKRERIEEKTPEPSVSEEDEEEENDPFAYYDDEDDEEEDVDLFAETED